MAEILIIGTGRESVRLPDTITQLFQQLGIQYEAMSSRKACSTYNVLVEEDRAVAAFLLPQLPISAREPNLKDLSTKKPKPVVL